MSQNAADRHATSFIAGAMMLPIGAADYLIGGWSLVVTTSVVSFLLGIALTVWSAWHEAKR
jgi:hypothetical protein